jgi:uncharacterized protein
MVEDVLLFAAVGFAAQMIDGAIGMAYGLSATNVLLALGVTPAMASASVHAAEVCTTGASGLAHWHLGNVQRDLVLRLALPGMLGGILGAYVLVGTPVETVRVFVSAYLLTMGGVILYKALRPRQPMKLPPWRVAVLGFCGGTLDAIGGGGWGAVINSTLIGQGSVPRMTIGSANLAEFFVTTAPCCRDRRIGRCEVGWDEGEPSFEGGRHAVQSQCRLPTPYPGPAASG